MDPITRQQNLLEPAGPLTGAFHSVQKGLPVSSYEHAPCGIWTANLTSLWNVIFFTYLYAVESLL
jgi:hypothetical protein